MACLSGKTIQRSCVSSDSRVKLGSACLVLSRVPVRAGLGHLAAIGPLGDDERTEWSVKAYFLSTRLGEDLDCQLISGRIGAQSGLRARSHQFPM